jgi:hypothetical protein
MKNIPLITFFMRHWQIIVITVIFVGLCLKESIFQKLGALIYIPAVSCVAVSTILLIIHLLFRETLDKDFHAGSFVSSWNNAEPKTRLILTVVILCAFFIGECIVGASVGR